MMYWNESNIPDLSGKTAIVTGANSGLGYQTALQLAGKNARVVMACRNIDKAKESFRSIGEAVPNANLEILQVDLGSFQSIQNAADKFIAENEGIDILVNNAGIGGFPYGRSSDDIEVHFAVNHLGHFLFTGKLLDLIRNRPGARVVTVSSIMNRIGRHDFEDINYEKRRYNRSHAYGRSKLANLLFSNELDKLFKQHGIQALAATAHPGYSSTSFQGKGPEMENAWIRGQIMKISNALFAQTDKMGALPTLYAAVADGICGGDYVGPSFLRVRGYPSKQRALSDGYNADLARKLWSISEEMTGFTYDF